MKDECSTPKAVPNPFPIPSGWPKRPEPATFYGLAGEIVHTLEPHTEADPVGLLLQLNTAFGNAAGNGPHVNVGADRHALNLFVAMVGTSAKARKGTSWGQIRRIVGGADPVWARERLRSGLSSGEGLIEAVRDGAQVDPAVTDKRLMVFGSELGGILRVMSRRGNTLSTVIRQAWDEETLQVMTKRFPQKATGAHISIIAQTTQADLDRYLTRTDVFDGFANRFLWACVRRWKLLPHGGQVPENRLQVLTERLRDALDFARQAGELRFSVNSRKLWAKEYMRLTRDVPGLLGASTSRAEPQVLRLAAIYALLNRRDEIRTQHLEAALAVWTFCFESARFIFGGRSAISVEDKLLQILRGTTVGLTRTEISSAFHRHVPHAAITSALENLREQGLVKSRKESTGGRSAEHWSTAEGGQ